MVVLAESNQTTFDSKAFLPCLLTVPYHERRPNAGRGLLIALFGPTP